MLVWFSLARPQTLLMACSLFIFFVFFGNQFQLITFVRINILLRGCSQWVWRIPWKRHWEWVGVDGWINFLLLIENCRCTLISWNFNKINWNLHNWHGFFFCWNSIFSLVFELFSLVWFIMFANLIYWLRN